MKISDLTLPEHHSVSDWDKPQGPIYVLDSNTYYEPPSSFRISSINVYNCAILSRRSNCQCIPEGAVESAFRANSLSYTRSGVVFHNQSPLGETSLSNGYHIVISDGAAELVKTVNGSPNTIGQWSRSLNNNTWYRERYSFVIVGTDLFFRREYWDGAKWVQVGDDFFDSSPPWLNSTINRLGLFALVSNGTQYYVWHDETYLYKRA